MEADHVLAQMRHLHSDAAQRTIEILGKLEEVSAVVVDAAAQVQKGKTVLHKQNEAFLMDRVVEITTAVNELRGMESAIQQAARTQADQVISPLVHQMSDQVKKLSEKETYAMKFMQATRDTQEKMVNNVRYAIAGGMMFGLLMFAAGHFLK